MWVARIHINSKGTLIGSETPRYNITLLGFPLSYYYEKEWVVVHIAGTIFGKQKDKVNFVKALRKEKRTVHFEVNDDFFIGVIKDPFFTQSIYNKEIIHIEPAFISDKGYEIIHIGCFDRKPLTKAIMLLKKKYRAELLSLQYKKIKSISVIRIHPELTKKQKAAMALAIKHGYYHSPRRTDVQQLAALSGLSYATYQVHLRKAEAKLLPYFFE